MTTRVLVTGASGIAGRHLVDRLKQGGFEVVPVFHSPSADPGIVADLRDESQVQRLPMTDVIVHCAGLTPRRAWRFSDFHLSNAKVTGFLAAHAARGGASTFIQVSTMGRLRDHKPGTPGRAYVLTKWLAEREARKATRAGLAVWVLRCASMYGEYDRGSTARLIQAIQHRRFVLVGPGTQRKCLLYAGTLAAIVNAELQSPLPLDRTEPVADLGVPTLRELVVEIEAATGGRSWRVGLPDGSLPALTSAMRAVTRLMRVRSARSLSDAFAAAMRDVPCQPGNALERHASEAITLREGLRREVEWLQRTAP